MTTWHSCQRTGFHESLKQNGNYKGSEKNQPWLPEHLAELDLQGRCGVFS